MKNYWLKRKQNHSVPMWDFNTEIGRLTAHVEHHDFIKIYKEWDTIKESLETIYVMLHGKAHGRNCRIRCGKDMVAIFECSCSGFYPPDPNGLRKARFGHFEVFEDETLEPNVLCVEDADVPWTMMVFDNLAMFVAGT